jgi:hypothetical protein
LITFFPLTVDTVPILQFQFVKSPYSKSILDGQKPVCAFNLLKEKASNTANKRQLIFLNEKQSTGRQTYSKKNSSGRRLLNDG